MRIKWVLVCVSGLAIALGATLTDPEVKKKIVEMNSIRPANCPTCPTCPGEENQ